MMSFRLPSVLARTSLICSIPETKLHVLVDHSSDPFPQTSPCLPPPLDSCDQSSLYPATVIALARVTFAIETICSKSYPSLPLRSPLL